MPNSRRFYAELFSPLSSLALPFSGRSPGTVFHIHSPFLLDLCCRVERPSLTSFSCRREHTRSPLPHSGGLCHTPTLPRHAHTETRTAGLGPSLSSLQLRHQPHCGRALPGLRTLKEQLLISISLCIRFAFYSFHVKTLRTLPSPHLFPELKSRGPPSQTHFLWAPHLLVAQHPTHPPLHGHSPHLKKKKKKAQSPKLLASTRP